MSDCSSTDNIRVKYARKYLQYSTKLSKKYYTRNEEYLKAKNKTFRQNQFTYFVSGNSNLLPGAPNAESNIYRNTVNNIKCNNVENSPINYKYSVQGPVSNDLRIINLKRHLYKR